ncbi:hypothetical protein BMS3Abin04_01520 [bacterium BMS3Abin04]|nr:hypothetical protein BMS3Abin04_01520 [bacterium BMS3Abin04]
MKHKLCPTCHSKEIEVFFEIKNAPIFSLVTLKSKDEALNIPRKDITLSFCNKCGLIFNSSFDTSVDYFTQGYEDQQGFSQTFVDFITGVTKTFIDKYDLYNKTVVEIGCGKGDFINLLAELGNNKGIGIDPAWVPGRTKPNKNVHFIKEYYNEKHGELNADCICCRHTLEHIHATSEFMQTIKKSITPGKNTLLFFEVPSIIRILEIRAFWDIFYEHCTYLSPGSLARLFRLNGFKVEDLYIKNDDQYLFVEAKANDKISDSIHPLEESIEDLKKLTKDFNKAIAKQLNFWREKLKKFKNEKQKVIIWGGGSKSVGFLTQFNDLGLIDFVVDINPYM